jgi:hypothetical protein
VVPDAPRIAEQGFPPSFDWKFLPPKFYNSSMKIANSDMNLNRNSDRNGMKNSASAFEILSRNNSNLDEEVQSEEKVSKTELTNGDRPRTFV